MHRAGQGLVYELLVGLENHWRQGQWWGATGTGDVMGTQDVMGTRGAETVWGAEEREGSEDGQKIGRAHV